MSRAILGPVRKRMRSLTTGAPIAATTPTPITPAYSGRACWRRPHATTGWLQSCRADSGIGCDDKGPWKSIDDLEIAVAEYIDWFNHRRLHSEIGLVPPVEFEEQHYLHNPEPTTVGTSVQSLY